ncbi:hypothetical protein PY32053_03703 (plasmid) [Paracoccus yeei]|uniref:Cyclophilin-like domain-containing protein n=2 Tax=Paracoccus yeei TaxID=147645 RepID=A0A386US70_9RHOB|nr:hypothetical protein PY32053_03703 [Paracoccus yeei]
MRIRLAFADQAFTATLEDNPSSCELASMLPLDLTIEDYATNEKIAYLPHKLTEGGSARFGNEGSGRSVLSRALGQSGAVPRPLSLVARADPAGRRPFCCAANIRCASKALHESQSRQR